MKGGKKMQQLISIIVPVYNVQPYLTKCLQSIVFQTYKNLEIILVDDGSTDGSGMVCDEWAKLDPRIRVIHMKNGGVSKARNAGILSCTGELIGFIDADDWIEKDMFMCLSEACGNADMASCGWVSYSEGSENPVVNGRKQIYTQDFEEAVILMYEGNGYFTSMCNKLFRRNVIMPGDNPILLEQDLYIGEDELWLIKVMKNCGTFMFIPKLCYHYRARPGSATRIDSVTEKRMSVLMAKRRAIQELDGCERAIIYAQSAMYLGGMWMMIQCYVQGEREKQAVLRRTLKSVRKSFLKAYDIPAMSKLKMILLELEMLFRLPVGIVKATNNVKRHRK